MRRFLFVAINATALALATVAFAQMPPTKIGNSTKGKVLTNERGHDTLYVRQGFQWQIGLQRSLCDELATADLRR